jgi:hypothetical protein
VLIEVLFNRPDLPHYGVVILHGLAQTAREGDESATLETCRYVYEFRLEEDEIDSLGLLTAHGTRRVEDAVVRTMSEAMNRVMNPKPLVIKPSHRGEPNRGYFRGEASLG